MSESAVTVHYVLDTDTVTHQQTGNSVVIANLRRVDRSTVATTVVTMYEQLRGRLAVVNRKQDHAQLQLAYRRLRATQQYYCTAQVLPFDDRAIEIYHSLLAQKIRIGTRDLQIAAIVLANHAVLVTANHRHFDQIPDLAIEDWIRLKPKKVEAKNWSFYRFYLHFYSLRNSSNTSGVKGFSPASSAAIHPSRFSTYSASSSLSASAST